MCTECFEENCPTCPKSCAKELQKTPQNRSQMLKNRPWSWPGALGAQNWGLEGRRTPKPTPKQSKIDAKITPFRYDSDVVSNAPGLPHHEKSD